MGIISSPVSVVGSTIGRFFVGGTIGAVAGGIAYDGLVTGRDSIVHHEYQPYGEVATVTNMVHGHYNAGDIFDFSSGLGVKKIDNFSERLEKELKPEEVSQIYRLTNYEAIMKGVTEQHLKPPFEGNEVWVSETINYEKACIKQNLMLKDRNVLVTEVDK